MSDSYGASHALLSAALGGLLCVAASSCSDNTSGPTDPTNPANPTSPDSPVMPDASTVTFECDGGVIADAGVTSSSVMSMTLDDFTTQCNAQNGIVEIQPHCGGSNNCRGMSYDSETQTLLIHTCRGTNTCAGFSCIICD